MREKLLAAHRGLISVLVPKENERDLKEVPKAILGELDVILVDNMDEALCAALKDVTKDSLLGGSGFYSQMQGPAQRSGPSQHALIKRPETAVFSDRIPSNFTLSPLLFRHQGLNGFKSCPHWPSGAPLLSYPASNPGVTHMIKRENGDVHGQSVDPAWLEVSEGMAAPDFSVVNNDLGPVTLVDCAGKVTVISAVPSLDTPICDMETRRFNQEAQALGDGVKV